MQKHVVAKISQGKIGSKDSLGKVEILLQLKCGRPGGGSKDFGHLRTRVEGVKNGQNFADVLYVWPLIQIIKFGKFTYGEGQGLCPIPWISQIEIRPAYHAVNGTGFTW